MPAPAELLDAAAACREVATVAALALMRTDGDPDAALALLDDLQCPQTAPQGSELDCIAIAQQAIHHAKGLTGG